MNAAGGFVAGSIVAKLLLDKTGWDSSIKAVANDQREMTAHFGQLGASVQKIAVIAAAAASVVAAGLAVMVKKTAEAGDQLFEMSQKTGLSVELLSSYKLAAEKAGSSLEGLAIGVRFLSRNMYDAGRGVTAVKQNFQELGISTEGWSSKLPDINTMLLTIADRFAGMADGTEKTALAIKLLGRSGTELIPFLNLGSQGLKEEAALAEKLGIVFTTKTAAAAHELSHTLVDLDGAMQGFRNTIGNALIPVFNDFGRAVIDTLASMRVKLDEFAASGQLANWAKQTGVVFIGAFKFMVKAVEGLLLLMPTIKAGIGTGLAWTQDILGGIYEKLAKLGPDEGLNAKMKAYFADMASGARGAADAFRAGADENIATASDIVASFDPILDGLDLLKVNFEKGGTIGKKSFTAISGAVGLTEEDLNKFLEKLAKVNGAWEALGRIEEIPIEFDFTNLDAKHIEKPLQDMMDEAGNIVADESKRIGAALKLMGPDAMKGTKEEIAMISITLRDFGNVLPTAKVRELKDRLEELKAAAADPTPWSRFLDGVSTAFSKLNSLVSPIISQLQQNAEIAVENEYKTRLAYINANIKDEEARQKAVTALEAEYEIKKSAARAAAAKTAKAFSLASAIINVAEAVTKALAQGGFILGIPWAAIVAALGAVEIGAIIAQPIPLAEGASFEKPTLLVGEKGPEHTLRETKLVQIVHKAMELPRFNAAPAMAMAGAGGGGATVSLHINGPLIASTGYSRRDIDDAAEYVVKKVNDQLRRVGRRL